MKRGGPLPRRTPLKARPPDPEVRLERARRAADRARERRDERTREQLAQRREAPRPPRTRTPPKKAPRTVADRTPDPVTSEVRAAVAARSGGRCEARVSERCRGLGEHVHHRKLRRHGDHRPCNLLHVCHACHDRIHSSPFAREAWRRRFLVRSNLDPEAEPVRVAA